MLCFVATRECLHRSHLVACYYLLLLLYQFPVGHTNLESAGAQLSVDTCLEDDWHLFGSIANQSRFWKTSAFVSTLESRSQMESYPYQQISSDDKYIQAKLSVVERERLLGYPDGYVSGAGK